MLRGLRLADSRRKTVESGACGSGRGVVSSAAAWDGVWQGFKLFAEGMDVRRLIAEVVESVEEAWRLGGLVTDVVFEFGSAGSDRRTGLLTMGSWWTLLT